MLRYKLNEDHQEGAVFIPAGTISRQMTEEEFEQKSILPHLRTYDEAAISYFKFGDFTLPVTPAEIEANPKKYTLVFAKPESSLSKKIFTIEEVRSVVIAALNEVDSLVSVHGQRDGWVELNDRELDDFFDRQMDLNLWS